LYIPADCNDCRGRVIDSCVCGRLKLSHVSKSDVSAMRVTYPDQRWSVTRNTETAPTDAYGTIEFLGGPHPTKAQVCHK